MKLCIFGLGYIGLPTAAMFANRGFDVLGVDVDEERVKAVNNGSFEISEPGLKAFLRDSLNTGNLRASVEPEPSDVFIICVPTPVKDDKVPDISHVEAAGKEIAGVIQKGNMVILESTVPPGTTLNTLKPILEESGLTAAEDFGLCHCPERVMPGHILKELTENHRIIGAIDEDSSVRAKELYRSFVEGEIYDTDPTTAEFVKVSENTFRDVNIALANELALLCEEKGTNVWDVIKLANNHPRVNLHKPGPGVGGHCLPVDPWFLLNGDDGLIRKAREINDNMTKHVVQLVHRFSGGTVAILGVAYKADTDDSRHSPTLELFSRLDDMEVRLHDPHVIGYQNTLEETIRGANVLIFMVDHKEYSGIDPQEVLSLMDGDVVIDTRNCLDKADWEDSGARYVLMGNSKLH